MVSNKAILNLKLASKECGSAHSLLAENQPGHFILIGLEMPWTRSLKSAPKILPQRKMVCDAENLTVGHTGLSPSGKKCNYSPPTDIL